MSQLYVLPFPLSREDNLYWLYPRWYEAIRRAGHVFVEREAGVRPLLQKAGLPPDAILHSYDARLGRVCLG
jgi:hypothetical protein